MVRIYAWPATTILILIHPKEYDNSLYILLISVYHQQDVNMPAIWIIITPYAINSTNKVIESTLPLVVYLCLP